MRKGFIWPGKTKLRDYRGEIRDTENGTPLHNHGETPLEYMLRIMRDEAAESTRRDDMAKAAAPYLHPRLSSVEHTGEDEAFPKAADLTDDQLAAIVAGAKLTVIKTA